MVMLPEKGAVVVVGRTRRFENDMRHFEVPLDARITVTRIAESVWVVRDA